MVDLERLLSPAAIDVMRAAGLHKVAGAMHGHDEMTARLAVDLVGRRAYVRRKTARLVVDGVISLAAATKSAMSPEAVADLRRAVAPGAKGI